MALAARPAAETLPAGEFLDSFSAHTDDGAGSQGPSEKLVTTTLLCVDDSKTMRRVLEITFAGENYRTVLAESADDALAKLRAEKPAVAVVDANLGAQSGYDLCQEIKRQATGVGVVILSSKLQPYDKVRGSSVGADDFIDKPFDTQQLIDKVAAAVRRAAEPRAAEPLVAGTQPYRSPAAAPAPPPMAPAAPSGPAPAAQFSARPRANTLSYGAQSAGGAVAHAPSPPAPQAAIGARSPTYPSAQAHVPAAASAPVAAPVQARSAAATEAQPIAPTPATGLPLHSRAAAASSAAALPADGQFADRLEGLGLTQEQVQSVLALSREVVEKIVWEVVPVLAETMIKEEIKRLTSE